MGENLEGRCWQTYKTPYITFVWAEDINGLIGQDDALPWNLPADMKHFVDVTRNGVVIMGRKTYESIPNPPLVNRINIVLTKNEEYQAEGAIVCHSKAEVLKYLKENDIQKPIHIIGGASIYDLFMDEVNILYRTTIDEVFAGDTYMPKIDYKYFRCIDIIEGTVDEKNKFAHRFFVYERKKMVNLFEE